ncbi:MAG: hypothetical protein QW423_02295 [Candidatus Aenigmatarchaeota archaeon]
MDSGEELEKEEKEIEEKFKFALLQVDKRLVNLEIAIGEIKEKLKSIQIIDVETINSIRERLDELEDLIMVENLGGFELKKILEDLNSKTTENYQKILELSKEVKNFAPQIEETKKLEEEINNLANKIGSSESPIIKKIEEDISDLKNKSLQSALKDDVKQLEKNIEKINERVSSILIPTEQIVDLADKILSLEEKFKLVESSPLTEKILNLENEIKRLEERIKPLETQVIQRIATEVSELRAETSREIKEIKDKISGIISTKSEIDIKFLSSRLNSLKENIDYLLNRKAEFDLRLESFQKALAKLAERIEELAERSALLHTSVEEKLVKLEDRIENMPNGIFASLKDAFSKLPEAKEIYQPLKNSKMEIEIKNLVEKISDLEDKLVSLEGEEAKASMNQKDIMTK